MLDSVKATILRYNMLDGQHRVTVALSGGADSVALLSVLSVLREQLGISVSAAHLNHCLRGDESDRDEQYVRELCSEMHIPLVCEKADVKGFAENEGISIELAARKVRYEFLERVSDGLIATAHTASDNIETVLHNMARGTGLTGVCGIPPKRGRFIRPLLGVTRAEVEQYCREKGLHFCIDSTNADESYTRNFIRHSVVPKILEVNSQAVKNTARMSEYLRDDADYLKKVTADTLKDIKLGDGLDVQKLKSLHPAIRSRCIATFYEQCVGQTPEHQHITAVTELLDTAGKTGVSNCFWASCKNGILRFVPLPKGIKLPECEAQPIPFEYNGIKIYTVSLEKYKKILKFNSLLLNNAVDYDKICGKLVLRGRLGGDRIRLSGRNCTKTLKKLFNESKLDEYLREGLAVAADSEGVVWLQGFGNDSRVSVDENTDTVLVFDVSNSMNEGNNNG